MRVKVRFTAKALRNLSEIGEYIAQDDQESVDSVVAGLYGAARGLGSLPGLPYTIVCREKDAEVQVLRVLHAARAWPRVIA